MEQNLGEGIAHRVGNNQRLVMKRVLGIIILVMFGSFGFMMLPAARLESAEIWAYASIGFGVVLCIILFLDAKLQTREATLYSEGVVVKNGWKVSTFHFKEIAGLRDMVDIEVTPVAGGLIGGLIMGAAIDKMRDALEGESEYPLRDLQIVSKQGERAKVVNTAGEALSRLYSTWLIKELGITKDNVNELSLSFGDVLKLDRGTLIGKRERKDRVDLGEIVGFEAGLVLSLSAINEKGKTYRPIHIEIKKVLNVDLLLYLVKLAQSED